MNTTMQTLTPADSLALGRSAMSPCGDLDQRTVIGVTPATRVAPFQGSGVPAGGTAARLRQQVQAGVWNFTHNSIGTTLGIHSSRRPQS